MCDQCDYRVANVGRASEAELDAEYERLLRRRLRELVANQSWLVTSVEAWPPLSYTIGLWSRGLPELCVFGLQRLQAQALLNEVGQMTVDGQPLGDGDEIVCDHGLPMVAFLVPDPH
jgi:Domain of unknown function (DUF4262)